MKRKRQTTDTETQSSQPRPPKPQLVRFTDREERMINRACVLAAEFMESYGKGQKPCMIHKEHYIIDPPLL